VADHPFRTLYTTDRYEFTDGRAHVIMERVAADRNGSIRTDAEVRWNEQPDAGLLKHGNLNLSADTTVTKWANACEKRIPEYDWHQALTTITYLAKERYRTGDPLIPLITIDGTEQQRWLLRPILEHGGPTVVAAPGGSAKSFLALAALATACTGRGKFLDGLNIQGSAINGAYLDWESDGRSHSNRLEALCEGAQVDYPSNLLYRREYAPFAQSAPELARQFAEQEIGMCVIDSKGAALGGAPEDAGEALAFFRAVASLRVPTLIVDHVTNEAADNPNKTQRPFGSVYNRNMARNVWTVRQGDSGDDSMTVVWKHAKSNNGPLKPNLAWSLGFDMRADEMYRTIKVKQMAARDVSMLPAETELPLHVRLSRIMSGDDYEPKTTAELLVLLPGVGVDSLRSRLSGHPDFLNVGSRGKAIWALTADRAKL